MGIQNRSHNLHVFANQYYLANGILGLSSLGDNAGENHYGVSQLYGALPANFPEGAATSHGKAAPRIGVQW